MDLVTIDQFVFAADAEVARTTLEAAGIDAVLVADSSKPTETIRLQVHAEDVEDAREILEAQPVEVKDETAGSLDGDEQCRRCFSTEIYVVHRARAYASAFLATFFGLLLLTAARGALAFFGQDINPQIINGLFATLLLMPFIAALYVTVAPKKRCRNCGLEWRGTQRPS